MRKAHAKPQAAAQVNLSVTSTQVVGAGYLGLFGGGQYQAWTTPGTYTWIAPAGVTSIAMVMPTRTGNSSSILRCSMIAASAVSEAN